jgi:hypothetical protein
VSKQLAVGAYYYYTGVISTDLRSLRAIQVDISSKRLRVEMAGWLEWERHYSCNQSNSFGAVPVAGENQMRVIPQHSNWSLENRITSKSAAAAGATGSAGAAAAAAASSRKVLVVTLQLWQDKKTDSARVGASAAGYGGKDRGDGYERQHGRRSFLLEDGDPHFLFPLLQALLYAEMGGAYKPRNELAASTEEQLEMLEQQEVMGGTKVIGCFATGGEEGPVSATGSTGERSDGGHKQTKSTALVRVSNDLLWRARGGLNLRESELGGDEKFYDPVDRQWKEQPKLVTEAEKEEAVKELAIVHEKERALARGSGSVGRWWEDARTTAVQDWESEEGYGGRRARREKEAALQQQDAKPPPAAPVQAPSARTNDVASTPRKLDAEEQKQTQAQENLGAPAAQVYAHDVHAVSQYAFDGGEGSKFAKLYVSLPQLPQLLPTMVHHTFTHSSAAVWVDCAATKKTLLLSLPDLLYEIDASASKIQVKPEKKQVVIKLRKRQPERAWVSATKA